MNDERLAELERLCEAATPGPWAVSDDEIVAGKVHVVCFGHDYGDYGSMGVGGATIPKGSKWEKGDREAYQQEVAANLALLAAAPELLAEVRRLREELAARVGD